MLHSNTPSTGDSNDNKIEQFTKAFPSELITLISLNLNFNSLLSFALVNRHIHHTISHSNEIWKRNYQFYFPDLFAQSNQALIQSSRDNESIWYREFRSTCEKEFNQNEIIKIHCRFKDKNFYGMSYAELTCADNLKFFDEFYKDNIKEGWIDEDTQLFLDGCYKIASRIAMQKIDEDKSLLYWAIRCYQPIDLIYSIFLSEGDITVREVQLHAIHLACIVGYFDVVQTFIEEDPASINQEDSFGQTPLYYAAEQGHASIVSYLINVENVDMNKQNACWESIRCHGHTPLHMACLNGHTEVAMLLIAKDAELKISTQPSYFHQMQWPIHSACVNGHLEIIKLLLAKDPTLATVQDHRQHTLLHWASMHNQTHIAAYLIEHHPVNVNQKIGQLPQAHYSEGCTPLDFACMNGCLAMIKVLLLQGKADISFKHGTISELFIESTEIDLLSHKMRKQENQQRYVHELKLFAYIKNEIYKKNKKPMEISVLGISMFTPKEEDVALIERRKQTSIALYCALGTVFFEGEEKIMINDIEIDFSKTNINLNDYQDILTTDDKLGDIYKYLQSYLPETVKKVQAEKEERCTLQ